MQNFYEENEHVSELGKIYNKLTIVTKNIFKVSHHNNDINWLREWEQE